MTAAPALLGAVLNGGASRRFGRRKDEAAVGGVAMGVRAVRALEPHVYEVVVVGRPLLALSFRGDRHAGLGPLGGLETALAWAEELGLEGILVLACDLPLVDADVLAGLMAAWRAEDDAVVPVRAGRDEPLCAGYRLRALDAVREALAGTDHSLHGLLARLRVRRVRAAALTDGTAAADPFLNVNTTAERDRAEVLLRARGPKGEGGGG